MNNLQIKSHNCVDDNVVNLNGQPPPAEDNNVQSFIETFYVINLHIGFREKQLRFSAPNTRSFRRKFKTLIIQVRAIKNIENIEWYNLLNIIKNRFRKNGFMGY